MVCNLQPNFNSVWILNIKCSPKCVEYMLCMHVLCQNGCILAPFGIRYCTCMCLGNKQINSTVYSMSCSFFYLGNIREIHMYRKLSINMTLISTISIITVELIVTTARLARFQTSVIMKIGARRVKIFPASEKFSTL